MISLGKQAKGEDREDGLISVSVCDTLEWQMNRGVQFRGLPAEVLAYITDEDAEAFMVEYNQFPPPTIYKADVVVFWSHPLATGVHVTMFFEDCRVDTADIAGDFFNLIMDMIGRQARKTYGIQQIEFGV